VLLKTKVDAQCDKLAMSVGRTKLTTLATVEFCYGKNGTKYGKFKSLDLGIRWKYPYFWRYLKSEFPYNTV